MYDLKDLYERAEKKGIKLTDREKAMLERGFKYAFECIGVDDSGIDEVVKGKAHNIMRSISEGSGWYFNEVVRGRKNANVRDGVLIVLKDGKDANNG